MNNLVKQPSFYFYQQMFDFIVNKLRSRFFTGKLTDEQFTNGMLTITDFTIFEKFFDTVTATIRGSFFNNKMTPEKFASSMQVAVSMAVKVASLKDSHTVIFTEKEFNLLKMAYEFQEMDMNELMSFADARNKALIQDKLMANRQAFEILKAHITIKPSITAV